MSFIIDYTRGKIGSDFSGTDNVGNSCYFNVCVRTLSYHPIFMQALEQYALKIKNKQKSTEELFFYELYSLLYNIQADKNKDFFSCLYRNFKSVILKREENDYRQDDPCFAIECIIDKLSELLKTEQIEIPLIASYFENRTEHKISYNQQTKKYFFEKIENKPEVNNDRLKPIFSSWENDPNAETEVCFLTDERQGFYNEIVLTTRKYSFSDVVIVDRIGECKDKEKTVRIQKGNGETKDVKISDLNLDLISNIKLNDEEYVLVSCGIHTGDLNSGHWTMIGFKDADINNAYYYNDEYVEKITSEEQKKKIKNKRQDIGPMVYIKKSLLGKKKEYELPTETHYEFANKNQEQQDIQIENIKFNKLLKIKCFKEITRKMIDNNFVTEQFLRENGVDDFFLKEEIECYISEEDQKVENKSCFSLCKNDKINCLYFALILSVNNNISDELDKENFRDSLKDILVGYNLLQHNDYTKSKQKLYTIINKQCARRKENENNNNNLENNFINNNDDNSENNFINNNDNNLEDNFNNNNNSENNFINNNDNNLENNLNNNNNERNIQPTREKKRTKQSIQNIKNNNLFMSSGQQNKNSNSTKQPQRNNNNRTNISPNVPNISNTNDTRRVITPDFKNITKEPKREQNRNLNKINRDEEYNGNQQYNGLKTFKTEKPPRPVIEFWVYLLCIIIIGFLILLDKLRKQREWDREYKNSSNYSGNNFYNLNNSDRRRQI